MSKVRKKSLKLQIKRAEKLKQLTCENCSNFLIVKGKMGICPKRETVVYSSYYCPLYEEGKPMKADLNTIAMFYNLFKEAEEEYKRNRDFLRDVLISEVQGRKETEEFEINVQEVTMNRLNVKKVRDFLKKHGLLKEFLESSKYYRVEVKKKLK